MHATFAEEDRSVVIDNVSWDSYVQMDSLLGGASVRMKWFDERLELMSPISRCHELIKTNIGCMIESFCRRNGIFFGSIGSTTMRKENESGGEPDASYIFTRGRELAELVVEAALTSGGIDDLKFYRPHEIPEVWIWQKQALTVHVFRDGEYVRAFRSGFLPGLDLALVELLADHPYTSDMLDEFERALAKG